MSNVPQGLISMQTDLLLHETKQSTTVHTRTQYNADGEYSPESDSADTETPSRCNLRS